MGVIYFGRREREFAVLFLGPIVKTFLVRFRNVKFVNYILFSIQLDDVVRLGCASITSKLQPKGKYTSAEVNVYLKESCEGLGRLLSRKFANTIASSNWLVVILDASPGSSNAKSKKVTLLNITILIC